MCNIDQWLSAANDASDKCYDQGYMGATVTNCHINPGSGGVEYNFSCSY